MDFDNWMSIIALGLLIVVSAMIGAQYIENKNKKSRGLGKMKYTCGVEGGCEMSMNGTYDSREQCEAECQNAK
jgi:hypothetical protein